MATILKESVVRNLTKTIAAVSLLAPATAFPLGIGDIKLHSALNQKLDAEIALILSANESISDIKVSLAPPEKFDEAGVPWSYFLSKIKFKSIVRRDGATIIKLSSNETLREPFLDFLLEVSWKNGNLYREFTVLVDPPVAYTQPVIPVIKKAESAAITTPIPEPLPVPIPQPEAEFKPAQAIISETVVNPEPAKQKTEYGPTRRSDSLWKVAKRTNTYSDVSIEQMMLAIYETNPQSFYKKNVNALMAGQKLDIPEREVILKLSHKQALAEFRQHNNVWKGRVVAKVKKAKSAVKPAVVAKSKEQVNVQLELKAPVEAEIVEAAIVVAADDSTVSKKSTPEAEKGLASTSNEGLALQARMEKLEKQLVMMQKMLALKDEQLAALQAQVKTEKPSRAQTIVEEVPATAVKTLEQPEHKTPIVESKAIIPPEPKKTKVETKPKLKPIKKPMTQPEPEDGIMSNPLYLAIGGIGVAILAVLGLFLWRRKSKETETDTESMFATASEISLPDSEAEEFSTQISDDETAYDVGTVGESSFLSEFTPSDFDAFDTDQNEVDPISEADVYLAYGRYQQAEDLMRQAIEDQPERDECKLKLLEIFYANENKSGFAAFANELISSGKHNDQDFWSKVVEMGVELDPDSSLYSSSVDDLKAVGGTEALAIGEVSGDGEADFDLSVFDKDLPASEFESKTEIDAENIEGLDFDLSVFDLDGEDAPAVSVEETKEPEPIENEIESIDFDFSLSEGKDTEPAEAAVATEDVHAEEIESFDFDMNTESLSIEPESNTDENSEFSPEIAVTENSSDTSVAEDIQSITEDLTGTEDFSFDFDPPPDLTSADSSLNEGTADTVSDLTDMDELETKIDLAKAYIDMGDADAAKGIAKEVLEKGSEEQKIAAQAVIDQIE